MSDLPSMPLFVDDYEAATAHLSLEEDGAYNRLLRLCWRHSGCSIPADEDWIMRRMRCDQGTFDRVVKPVISEFFTRENGRLYQRRQRRVHEDVMARVQRRKDAGSKGGFAKAKKTKGNVPSNATDLLVAKTYDCPSNQNQNQIKEPTSVASLGTRKRGRVKTAIDPEALFPEQMRAIAEQRGLSDAEAEAQFARFRDWAVAKGQTYADWTAAWRNWLTSPHFRPVIAPLRGQAHEGKATSRANAFIAGARRTE